jgi:hypothetical protein
LLLLVLFALGGDGEEREEAEFLELGVGEGREI